MSEARTRFYLGSYTATSGGRGEGVSVFERQSRDGQWKLIQVAPVDDPSFLTLTEGEVHVVSETAAGRVVSFTNSAGELVPASIAASGGSAPCHVVVDPASGSLVVANYTAGTVAVLSADALDPARVARVLPLPAGTGPHVERQEAPHAHSATPTPWGTLLVADLGTDRLFEVAVDPITLEPSFVGAHALPAGSGPRHLAWLGEQLVVAGELDGCLHVLSHSAEGFTLDYSVLACDPSVEAGTGETLLSHIEVQGGRVYVAVRGRDTLAVLAGSEPDGGTDTATDTATAGRLALVAEVPCGGRWPRHFAIDAGEMLVANQLSDTVAVLPIDPATGVPGAPTALIATGSPACIAFA
ncbi:beta-propeller fold lactonase family protein [Frondihabitans sp. 4ASC-45]|uniref:lactonase family protein n=1 Tax=Frondihabitans sp. 4ASC-45 TaxID=3111636 RepID=UPI003C1EE83A